MSYVEIDRDTLQTLIDAARDWSWELAEHVIPATMHNGRPIEALGLGGSMDAINKAVVDGLKCLEPDDDEPRECDRCGDEVSYLNTSDECLACEAVPVCPGCGEREGDHEIFELSEGTMCASCIHNARRSGADI